MDDELRKLEEELKKVKSSKLEYLPEYGYSSKEDIIQLINEDIKEVKNEIKEKEEYSNQFYEEQIMESERTNLCLSLGIPRFC